MISRNQHRTDIWPGFVDALAALLMVIIFLLMVFVIAQFFLNDALTGRDEALERLQVQVSNLADLLSLERQANEELRASTAKLSDELQASISISDGLKKQVKNLKLQAKTAEELAANLKNELALSLSNIGANEEIIESQLTQINALRNDVESLKALREELEEKVTQLLSKVSNKDEQLITEKKLSQTARAQIALLNKQVTALRKQILQIANILQASEKIAKKRRVKIVNLGKRLNAALASKVQELARYRSEFFGRLRDVLGSQPGIRIVGDRFVFQSEVLFSKGSDQLENEGQKQIQQLAGTLKAITVKIPKNIDWILRVDGHTDQIPIRTTRFPSNWELSTARAISVVKFLVQRGISPTNLAATGFGEFQPIDPRDTEEAYIRNRRIELKLTQR
ncbi:MAG TPA: peptidoglycan -binding protein [Rhodospirillales bacterium]|nr:peptidoglycan -binding protein [Rhodospirillales bacterium]